MYYLADGSAFRFERHTNRDIFFYPRNPEKCLKKEAKGQNVTGICVFAFLFCPVCADIVSGWDYLHNKGLEPYLYDWDGNMTSLYKNLTSGCNIEANGNYCTAIIQRNGWKVPKDYPRRISY